MTVGNRLIIISRLFPIWMGGAEEEVMATAGGPAENLVWYRQLAKSPFYTFGPVLWLRLSDSNSGSGKRDGDEFLPTAFEDSINICLKIATAIERMAGPNDTIWIKDDSLFPLAGLVRTRFPEVAIGLWIGLPFPSGEEFRKWPAEWREEVLLGMLSADVIGFKTKDDSARFLRFAETTVAIDKERDILRYGERLVKIGTFVKNDADSHSSHEESITGIDIFLNEIRAIKKMQDNYQVRFFDIQSRDTLLERYRNAKKRLFLLDYDGTLTPSFHLPSLAGPDNLLLDILNSMAQNWRNSVYIISGRDSRTLEKWLGHLPVNIIAEHGARIRYNGKVWEKGVPAQDSNDEAEPSGKDWGKGAAIRHVLCKESQDFILAIGDDRTDEDMFVMLSDVEQACTIMVGKEASFARYNLQTPQMVISLLGHMSFMEQQSYR